MKYRLLAALVVAALSANAFAATDIKNISTGFNDVGNVQLGDSVLDTDWSIVAGGTAGHVGDPLSAILNNVPGPYIPDNDSTASRWIGVITGAGSFGIDIDPGTYVFSTSVNVDPLMATATIGIHTLRFAADNNVL